MTFTMWIYISDIHITECIEFEFFTAFLSIFISDDHGKITSLSFSTHCLT